MGVQLRFGTVGATGGGLTHQPGSLHPTMHELLHHPRWSWQARGPMTQKDKNKWTSLWSWGARLSGGQPFGGDGEGFRTLAHTDLFEPYSCDGEGTQTYKFIKGLCVDAADVPIANAEVQAFVTNTDIAQTAVFSRNDGSYDAPTQAPGVAHYIVAYKTGSPDIGGTTVNTLIPTNIDGT